MTRIDRAIVVLSSRRSTIRSMKPFLDQELAALEALGQFLPDRLFDDARSGESDERLGLRDVQIAQHREARRHAAGRRIREDGQVGQAGAIEAAERRADLRHLHQRERALHHAGAAGARHDNERRAHRSASSAPRVIFSPTTTPMLPPMKLYSIDAITDGHLIERAGADNDRVVQPGRLDAALESRPVRLGVGELEGIDRAQARVVLGPLAAVEQELQPFGRAHAEVVTALVADLAGCSTRSLL